MNDSILCDISTRALPHFSNKSSKKWQNQAIFSFLQHHKTQKSCEQMFERYFFIIIHPKDIKKLQALSIWDYYFIGFVTLSDHCALLQNGKIWAFVSWTEFQEREKGVKIRCYQVNQMSFSWSNEYAICKS